MFRNHRDNHNGRHYDNDHNTNGLTLFDTFGNDNLFGGWRGDTIYTRFGADRVSGSSGNDMIQSRSDAGEPNIAQATTASKVHANQPFAAANDTLKGGRGADTFDFRIDLNAKEEIIDKHVNADGTIDWTGVTGENGNVHDHWLESIGTDTIVDFQKGVDKIKITGHTVTLDSLVYSDVNKDGREDTTIKLKSDQGAAGAHDEDQLGSIVVLGNHLTANDFTIDAMQDLGVADTHDAWHALTDMMIA